MEKRKMHELLPFLAIHAVEYQKSYGLNGLHPTHYDLMVKYGARMVDFKRATNAPQPDDTEAQAGSMK
jgi:hypothetical protein